jgi:hypothetical protein
MSITSARHTSHGADPNIYIPDRYVIGQVGFMQHAISDAITRSCMISILTGGALHMPGICS